MILLCTISKSSQSLQICRKPASVIYAIYKIFHNPSNILQIIQAQPKLALSSSHQKLKNLLMKLFHHQLLLHLMKDLVIYTIFIKTIIRYLYTIHYFNIYTSNFSFYKSKYFMHSIFTLHIFFY